MFLFMIGLILLVLENAYFFVVSPATRTAKCCVIWVASYCRRLF